MHEHKHIQKFKYLLYRLEYYEVKQYSEIKDKLTGLDDYREYKNDHYTVTNIIESLKIAPNTDIEKDVFIEANRLWHKYYIKPK